MSSPSHASRSFARTAGRVALGAALIFAGTSHLTVGREEFRAQVPTFVPFDADATVVGSGVAEIALGTALIVSRKKRRAVGILTALFFGAVFPGNLSQWVNQRNAFGLDTDTKRGVRLLFQPLLVVWALWSTGAGCRRARR